MPKKVLQSIKQQIKKHLPEIAIIIPLIFGIIALLQDDQTSKKQNSLTATQISIFETVSILESEQLRVIREATQELLSYPDTTYLSITQTAISKELLIVKALSTEIASNSLITATPIQTSEQPPLNIVLSFDNSYSFLEYRDQIIETAILIVDEARDYSTKTRIGLTNFGDTSSVLLPLTFVNIGEIDHIKDEILKLSNIPPQPNTSLFEGIRVSYNLLLEDTNNKTSKGSIVIFTDGRDNNTTTSLRDLRNYASQENCKIFFIIPNQIGENDLLINTIRGFKSSVM